MRLHTEVDQIACQTSGAALHVGSTVQSLRLVKNLVDMLYGGGEFHFAYLRQGKKGHACVSQWARTDTFMGRERLRLGFLAVEGAHSISYLHGQLR